MIQYIDKSVLVAEIERRKQVAFGWMETAPNDAIEAEFGLCDDILSFINTLEVKEVDFEEYYHKFLQKEWFGNSHLKTVSEMMAFTAKHFFELSMQVSNKAQKDK